MKRHIFFLFIALTLTACSLNDRDISAQITAQFEASKTVPINLAQVGPPSWERFCVLLPHSTNETAAQVLGFKWDVKSNSAIVNDEKINLLVFIKNNEVLAITEHRRDKGDFLRLEPKCLARAQAVLVRRVEADGLVQLVSE